MTSSSKYLAELHKANAAAKTTVAKTTKVAVSLSEEARGLIDAAAAALGQTRQAYVLDSAHLRAVDVLLDQRIFHLGDSAANLIHDALITSPIQPAAALVDLLRGPSPESNA